VSGAEGAAEVEDAEGARGSAGREPRLREGLVPCLWVFLALRIGVSLLCVVSVGLFEPRAGVGVPGWAAEPSTAGWHNLFTGLVREDALWFLRIVASGYSPADGSAAFFPLYPMLARGASVATGGHPLLGALLVSNGAFFLALLVLYDLARREYSDAVARRTIVYLSVFPTSFFFLAPYSESLFLLLSVATFRFARRDRWWPAALAGALAAATRSIGVVLAPALLVMALGTRRTEAERPAGTPTGRRVVASLAVLAGPLLYFAWWQVVHGDLLAPFEAQQNWQRVVTFPLATLWRATEMALGLEPVGANGYWIIDFLIVGVVVAALVMGWRRMHAAYLTYAGLGLLLPLAYPFPSRPLLSMARFVAVIFPAFWAMADASVGERLPHTAIVAGFAGGLGLLTVLFSTWWYIF
jgi:mannosyltransferase PIG-V